MAGESARLFIGLWPGEEVRDAVMSHADAWAWPRNARRVPRERLHITLHFLGMVPRARLEELATAITMPGETFDLRLTAPVLWPRGIAVLCPPSVPPAAMKLHARLAEALLRFGHEPETRAWKPHVTLARDAVGAVLPAESVDIAWRVSGHVLVESASQQYTVLRRFA